MDIHPLAFLLLLPFIGVFGYAAWHEIGRYRSEGRSTYGLSYDPETNTTYVSALSDEDEGFDPETYEPEAGDSAADDDPGSADADGGTGRART